jgi:hypothetical protein
MTTPSLPRPAPAKLLSRTEFSVTLAVPRVTNTTTSSSSWFRFEFKEASASWDTGGQHVDATPEASEVTLDDLNPTSTYEIRIYAVARGSDGAELLSPPSEVAAVDTEVPGCAPQSSGCLCVVQ